MTVATGKLSETSVLAQWVAALRLEDVPASARTAAKACILDSLGCAIAGIHVNSCAMMLDLLAEHAGNGTVAVAGTARRLPVTKAGYVMAQAANALDFDDSFREGAPSHPGATIIPPALALSDLQSASGAGFLLAVIAGYEASLRIGRAIHPTPERQKDVFGYPVWQSFGAASAAAVLLGLDQEQILDAFGIMAAHAPLPAGRKGGFDEEGPVPWIKNSYGAATEAGIWAAFLAQKGYRGHRGILDGPNGFWIMASSDRYVPQQVIENLGRQWLVERIEFKPYACCRWTHTLIDTIKECLPEIKGREIEALTVAGFRELAQMGKRLPDTLIDTQFNPRYLAALELSGKSPEQGLFEADLHDASVLGLTEKVHMVHDPEADEGFYKDAALPVRLTLRLADRTMIEKTKQHARGGVHGGLGLSEIPCLRRVDIHTEGWTNRSS